MIGYQLLGAFAVITLDRITKYWAQCCLTSTTLQWPWVAELELSFNRGVTFGLFHDQAPLVFWLIIVLVGFLLFCVAFAGAQAWRRHEDVQSYLIILAGGCSNLYDRLVYGGVIDFISLSPQIPFLQFSFNIADVAIIVGIMLLVLQRKHETYET